MTRQEVFAECRSGIAQICLERGSDRITAGSGFLVSGGLVSNSHVIKDIQFDVAVIRFEDMDYANGIRLTRDTVLNALTVESPREEYDVAFLQIKEPEFAGRHVFTFGNTDDLRIGDEVGFLGYPFQMERLTCHVGYVSSLHHHSRVQVIQIDGSVNGGNSGGPVVDLSNGQVVGIVTRAEVGFLADQFDQLIHSLTQNVEVLKQCTVGFSIGGIDPVQGLLSSQAAMREIAVNLRRSANVGIGYAFGTNYIRDQLPI